MGLKFKPGDNVRQVVPAPMEGVVAEAVVVDGNIHYKVDGSNGESKYFDEDQIEAVDKKG